MEIRRKIRNYGEKCRNMQKMYKIWKNLCITEIRKFYNIEIAYGNIENGKISVLQ